MVHLICSIKWGDKINYSFTTANGYTTFSKIAALSYFCPFVSSTYLVQQFCKIHFSKIRILMFGRLSENVLFNIKWKIAIKKEN